MRQLQYSACAMTCVALLTAGCGGGNNETEPRGTDPFPLSVGNRWEMDYQDSRFSSYTRVYEVAGSVNTDGSTSYLMRRDGQAGTDVIYQHPPTGVLRLPAPGDEDQTPQLVVKLPLHVGDSWVNKNETRDYGEDVNGDGVNEVETVTDDGDVTAIERVVTPAGTFDESYVVTSGSSWIVSNPVTNEEYYASYTTVRENYVVGIGVVSRDVTIIPAGGPRMYTSSEKLSAYRVAPN